MVTGLSSAPAIRPAIFDIGAARGEPRAMRQNAARFAFALLAAGASACRKDTNATSTPSAASTQAGASATPQLTVTSSTLSDGKPMPKAYVCIDDKHRDKSPPLAWSKGPLGTEYYAIEMLDLDSPHVPNDWDKEAKNFVHWRVINVPSTMLSVPESSNGAPPNAGMAVANDFGHGYGGPCPPPGAPAHRYAITVYALPKKQAMNLPIPKAEALATGTLTVTYAR